MTKSTVKPTQKNEQEKKKYGEFDALNDCHLVPMNGKSSRSRNTRASLNNPR